MKLIGSMFNRVLENASNLFSRSEELTPEVVQRQEQKEVDEIFNNLKAYDGGRQYRKYEEIFDSGWSSMYGPFLEKHEDIKKQYGNFEGYVRALIKVDIHVGRGGSKSILLNGQKKNNQYSIFYDLLIQENFTEWPRTTWLIKEDEFRNARVRSRLRHRSEHGVDHRFLQSEVMRRKLKAQEAGKVRDQQERARENAIKASRAKQQFDKDCKSFPKKLYTFQHGEPFKSLTQLFENAIKPEIMAKEYMQIFVEKDLRLDNSLLRANKFNDYFSIVYKLKQNGLDQDTYKREVENLSTNQGMANR